MHQLTPVCTHVNSACFPPRLFVTGYVNTVNRQTQTFEVATFQWIEGVNVKDDLSIVVLFKATTRWPIPNCRMPNKNGLVSFSRIIQHMQDMVLTVVIDTISFLNQKARPRPRSKSNTAHVPVKSHHRPSVSAQRCAKRRFLDSLLEALFEKEREFLDSD